jgi:hypothetical protein
VVQFEIKREEKDISRKGAKAQRRDTVIESLLTRMLPLRLCASSVSFFRSGR